MKNTEALFPIEEDPRVMISKCSAGSSMKPGTENKELLMRDIGKI